MSPTETKPARAAESEKPGERRQAEPARAAESERSEPLESGQLEQPEVSDIELTDVLHALSDPMRLHLVRELYQSPGERACNSFDLPIAKSTATHHWRVLREAGVVSAREEGTRKLHCLRRAELDARFPGLLDSVAGEPSP